MLISLLLATNAHANLYSSRVEAATGFDTTTTAVVWEQIDTGFPIDDDQQLVNIGFTFYFGTVAYTQVRVLSNGALHFGANQGFHKDYTNEALPITGSFNGPGFEEPADRAILPYWDDLEPSSGGTVDYDTLGTAPNRRFVVTWTNVPHYPNIGSYTIQVVLYENDANIRFRYGAGDANGASATIGIEVDDTYFNEFSFNSAGAVSPANDIVFYPIFPVFNTVSADCSAPDQVLITFNDPVNPVLAQNPANYSIDNGISVLSATVTGPNAVTLTTTTMTSGPTYTLQTLREQLQSTMFTLSTATSETYLDNFEVISYSNQDGTQNWATDWLEINESDGPNNGDERLRNNQGSRRLQVKDNNGGGEGVQREVDLSGFTSATLSFVYRRRGLDDVNDYVTLDISTNGGGSWTELLRFAGPDNDSGYTPINYDITAYIASNTRIRFLTSASLGNNDRVNFDDVQILATSTSVCAPTGPDHFGISHSGTGVTCAVEPVTVRAHQADHSDLTSYTGTMNLSTSTANGDWSVITGNGTLTPGAADSGLATYTYDATDNGVVILGLADTNVETTNINIIDGGATETSGTATAAEDLDLLFANTGFRFIDAADVAIILTQIAGKDSDVAPNASTLYLQAIRTSDSSNTCVGVFANGSTVNIDLGSLCVDPVSCLAGQRVNVTNNAVTTAIANQQNQDAGSNYTTVPLLFTTNSRAQLVLNYPDAGQIRMRARYDIPLSGGGPSGNLMVGNSNVYVSRPFGIDLDFSGDRAANGITGPSYAADANGSIFLRAGELFDTSLTAMEWSATDDTNNDGIPDACSDLTDNTVTANFGNETSAITPANLSLTHTLVEPTPGGVPGLFVLVSNGASFAGGIGTKNVYWDEVGIVDLSSTLVNYLGGGQNVSGNVCNLGRFRPDHFEIANQSLVNRSDIVACGDSFTYMNENFRLDFDLEAHSMAAANNGTLNYFSAFAKLDPTALASMNFGATASSTDLSARLNPTPVDVFANGVANMRITTFFARAAAPDGRFNPLEFGIAPTDSDGASLNTLDLSLDGGPNTHGKIDQTDMRYGRLSMGNSFGSELLPLQLPLYVQHYENALAGFINNTNDNCTTISTADVLLYNNTEPKTGRAVGNAVINITAGNPTTLTEVTAFTSGVANLKFSAPGVEGDVDAEVQTPAWLLSNLDSIDHGIQGPGAHCNPNLAGGDPAFIAGCATDANLVDDIPLSRGNFGIYRGNDRIIYYRELY